MFTHKLSSAACGLLACIMSVTVFAAEGQREGQRWRVHLVDDGAVLQASKDTEFKFVKATMAALQEAGTENISMRVMDSNDRTDEKNLAYSVKIVDDNAEITASTDLPCTYFVKTISQLKDSGVMKIIIMFRPSKESTDEAAPQR